MRSTLKSFFRTKKVDRFLYRADVRRNYINPGFRLRYATGNGSGNAKYDHAKVRDPKKVAGEKPDGKKFSDFNWSNSLGLPGLLRGGSRTFRQCLLCALRRIFKHRVWTSIRIRRPCPLLRSPTPSPHSIRLFRPSLHGTRLTNFPVFAAHFRSPFRGRTKSFSLVAGIRSFEQVLEIPEQSNKT